MPPQLQEADSEEMPMSYSVGKSSFGLLDEAEGSSHKLIASVALVSVILAGTFFIAVGIRRPSQAKAAETPQVHTTQVASSATPATPIPDLKTVDSVGLPAPTPAAKTEAVVPPPATGPRLQAQASAAPQVTAPVQAPTVKPTSKVDRTVKKVAAPRVAAIMTQKRAARSAKSVAAVQPQAGSSNLMTIMPDPAAQVEHHAAQSAPTAVPVSNNTVKNVQIPAARARKQVASTSVDTRIKPVNMGKSTTGKIGTAGIPATAGTGLVGAHGSVSSTGIPAGTVELTQADASKKVTSAGIPAATSLTVTSKRAVAPAPASLNMVSRRSNGPTKPQN